MVLLLTDIEIRGFDLVCGQFQVTARLHTERGCVNGVVGVVVIRHNVFYGLLVTDHVSREPPLRPQNVRQQTLVPTGWDSIYPIEYLYVKCSEKWIQRTYILRMNAYFYSKPVFIYLVYHCYVMILSNKANICYNKSKLLCVWCFLRTILYCTSIHRYSVSSVLQVLRISV